MSAIEIRGEQPADIDEIRRLTEIAFADIPFSEGDEQHVIDRLRARGQLALSLVALQEDRLVGHIAFSPSVSSCGASDWYALGPVSVIPERQRQGIGSALIREGMGQLASMGARGCILTGNPDYYRRFDFELSPAQCPERQPAEYFMVRQFGTSSLSSKFEFDDAFYGNA